MITVLIEFKGGFSVLPENFGGLRFSQNNLAVLRFLDPPYDPHWYWNRIRIDTCFSNEILIFPWESLIQDSRSKIQDSRSGIQDSH